MTTFNLKIRYSVRVTIINCKKIEQLSQHSVMNVM